MKALAIVVSILLSCLIVSCDEAKQADDLKFSTSADHPPFEYEQQSQLQGFDIELARLIAKELGKKAVFDDLPFNAVLPALNSGKDDVAIATLTVSEERKKNFDFSITYYFETMAAVFPHQQKISSKKDLAHKQIAVQLGSVLDLWVHQHFPNNEIQSFSNTKQALAALNASEVDLILVDGVQGRQLSASNPKLGYALIGKSNEGYALALKKGSPLTHKINKILKQLKAQGKLQKLEQRWVKL